MALSVGPKTVPCSFADSGRWVGTSPSVTCRRCASIVKSRARNDASDSFTEGPAIVPIVQALDSSEATALSVAPPNLPLSFISKIWRNYLTLLDEKPVFVKSLTSLFGFLIGDICAQLIVGADYDLRRTLRMTLFGILMDGPIGHCWYLFLDKNIYPEAPKEAKTIVAKTALDQLIWSPFISCVFFTFHQTFQGHPELSLQTIQNTLVPTLTANYALWPLAHLINFKFVPSNQRILYINFVQILWISYLSNLAARGGRHVTKVHQHLAHPMMRQWMHDTHRHLLSFLHHHQHHHLDLFHSHAHRIFG